MKRILVVFGTRPEAIKMAPVVKALKEDITIETRLCISSQHKELLAPMLSFFNLEVDYDLDVMAEGQSLAVISQRILGGFEAILSEFRPDILVVHGDTTTGFVAALSAYYHRVPVAHVEAGLRTGDMYSPWPEEGNRKLISAIAALNFAPTESARLNLIRENVSEQSVYVTGNTVVDALLQTRDRIESDTGLYQQLEQRFEFIDREKKLILVTGHRRESFGEGFIAICEALKLIAMEFEDSAEIVYPVHLNPNVRGPVYERLGGLKNLHLIAPVDYPQFVYLMDRCFLILTDSGGIQEEAPSFSKPVLVMREKTERMEAIEAGTARLVGSSEDAIVQSCRTLLTKQKEYLAMAKAGNPFGDGNAAERIAREIRKYVSRN